jgi:hypothetical protein
MMKWRERAMVPTIVLLTLTLLQMPLNFIRSSFPPAETVSTVVGLLSLVMLLPAGYLWVMLVGSVFEVGRRAFSIRAGLGYSILAVALIPFFGSGVFLVPLMVRSDIIRLANLGDEEADEASND